MDIDKIFSLEDACALWAGLLLTLGCAGSYVFPLRCYNILSTF